MRIATVIVLVVALAGSIIPAAAADLELGKKVYASKCVVCHGADGKGNAQMAGMLKVTIPDLSTVAAKPDAELVKFVAAGKKPMPAFADALSKEELQAVVEYAKHVGRGGK